MTPSAPTVTVTGPDRSGLLANLTVRFGRVEVLGERQVTLPDGTAGWELTVRHESFTAARCAGGAGAPAATDRAEAGDVRRDLEAATPVGTVNLRPRRRWAP